MEDFRLIYESSGLSCVHKETCTLREYIINQDHIPEKYQLYCYGMVIEKGSSYVGKSIRDSGLKSDRSCFVVGVERHLLPITEPSPNFVLRADDIIWILGTVETVVELLQDDAITDHEANAKRQKRKGKGK